jgi:hypothetical protein
MRGQHVHEILLQCCSVTSVLFVLVVYMEVVLEHNIVSDHIMAFIDDP